MITMLTIDEPNKNSTLKEKIVFKLSNPITIKNISYNNLEIKHILAKKRKNKICWNKICKLINSETIFLCPDTISFPENLTFTRYEPININKILCKNAALNIIKAAKVPENKLLVSILDPYGCHSELVNNIVPYLNQIKVITKNIEFYSKESEILMDKYGVSILVSDSKNWIKPCHILIAPDKINEPINLSKNCITFTGFRPTISLNGTIYYDYKINYIPKLSNLIPNDINIKNFLEAIFDNYTNINIDSITPDVCLSTFNDQVDLSIISQKIHSIVNLA